MSNEDRGRHRAAKHVKPKPPRKAPRRIGALFGVASVGSIAMTGGSALSASDDTSTIVLADPIPANDNTISIPAITVSDEHTSSLRAQAASRSDNRISLEDTKNLSQAANVGNTATNPTTTLDSSSIVNASQRRALMAVAGASSSYDAVVAAAQSQAVSEQQRLADAAATIRSIVRTSKGTASSHGPSIDVSGDMKRASSFAPYEGVKVVPLKGAYELSARFGQRGRLWSNGWHTGLDFTAPRGSTVVAAANGQIIAAGWAGAYGYRIEIQHSDGFVTTYNHLSKILVTSGMVRAGQVIGRSGSSGHTTGPHLHFEVLFNGALVNPSKWLWGR